MVKGIQVGEAQVGSTLGPEAEERLRMLTYLVDALEHRLPDVTQVDLTDRLNIQIVYQDRLLIQLGSEGDLEYKLQFVTYALENSVEDVFEGYWMPPSPRSCTFCPSPSREIPPIHRLPQGRKRESPPEEAL